MLTQIEHDYCKSLVDTYYSKGYKYYLIHTITDTNNNYDVCIYFSKTEISGLNDNYFFIDHGLRIYLDSSSKNYNYSGSRDTVDSFSGNVTIDVAEFIYTNAKTEYNYSLIPVNPDIMVDYSYNNINFCLVFLLVIFFLYFFIRDLFRIGGR